MFYYVYCITNLVTGKKYIGSRTSHIEPEFDLGYVYKSSSHNIEFINDLKTNPTCYKFCCSKTCFNKYIKMINNEYSDILSQARIRYIKENYDKICKINQNIAAHTDQKSKGLKISKTKRERYKFRTGGREAN